MFPREIWNHILDYAIYDKENRINYWWIYNYIRTNKNFFNYLIFEKLRKNKYRDIREVYCEDDLYYSIILYKSIILVTVANLYKRNKIQDVTEYNYLITDLKCSNICIVNQLYFYILTNQNIPCVLYKKCIDNFPHLFHKLLPSKFECCKFYKYKYNIGLTYYCPQYYLYSGCIYNVECCYIYNLAANNDNIKKIILNNVILDKYDLYKLIDFSRNNNSFFINNLIRFIIYNNIKVNDNFIREIIINNPTKLYNSDLSFMIRNYNIKLNFSERRQMLPRCSLDLYKSIDYEPDDIITIIKYNLIDLLNYAFNIYLQNRTEYIDKYIYENFNITNFYEKIRSWCDGVNFLDYLLILYGKKLIKQIDGHDLEKAQECLNQNIIIRFLDNDFIKFDVDSILFLIENYPSLVDNFIGKNIENIDKFQYDNDEIEIIKRYSGKFRKAFKGKN